MKKTLLLAAAWFLSLAASAQTESYTEYTYTDGTPQAATALENDGLYFIYDNFSGRKAFRYVNSGNKVCGTSGNPASGQYFNASYVWKAIQVDGGWQFQNVQNSKYIPAVNTSGANIITSETGGTYVLTARNNTSDNFAVTIQSGDNTYYWDGQSGDNPDMAIGNWNGTPDNPHIYQFYPVKAVDRIDQTITFVKGEVTYGVVTLTVNVGTNVSYPAELGTMGEFTNNAATFTFADDIKPVKISNARRQTQWMSVQADNLGYTAENTAYDDADWFAQQDVEGGIKLFAPKAGKYAGSVVASQPTALVDAEQAATLVVQRNQNGPSTIGTTNLSLNMWSGLTGGGTVKGHSYHDNNGDDAGSFWFFVYDYATFQSNLPSYLIDGTGNPYNVNAKFTNNNPWYNAQQEAKDAIVLARNAGVDETEISKVQAIVDQAATAQFGASGTDISSLISQLNSGAQTLDALTKRITVNFKQGDETIITATYTGMLPTFPAELGALGEVENDEVDFILADDVISFKLVCARYSGVWATNSDTGLTHTSNSGGSYAAGATYFMIGTDESCHIYVPEKGKYVGDVPYGDQVPYSDTAVSFTIEHNQNGPVGIKGSENYFNDFQGLNAGDIGGWSAGTDSGSYWFIVEDEETYNTNKEFYWKSDGSAYIDGYGNFTNNNPWYEAVQGAKNAITTADEAQVPDSYKEDLQALVNQAMTVGFGQKGVSIAKMIDDLTSGATTLNQVALGIDEVSIAGGAGIVVYDLQGRRLAAPVKGINIINGKKVLVK